MKWWVGLPDTGGAAKYVVIIRGKDDPVETKKRGHVDNPGGISWKEVDKHSPEEWRKRIVTLLKDGVPRTFNHIAVVLSGHTADVVFQKNPEKGLWLAVERGELEYTNEAPILFRIRKRGAYDVPVSPTKASRGRVVGPELGARKEYVPPRAPPKSRSPRIQKEITTQEAKREFEKLGRTGKTVMPAPPQKKIRGFAVYDLITIKKQEAGRRLPPFLLDTAQTLGEAQKIAKQWTILTGHSTTVKENGSPVASFDWNAQMTELYTKGWTTRKTAVTDGEKFGVFYYTRPSKNPGAGYEASVLWQRAEHTTWAPLTSLTKVPTVPAKTAPTKRPHPEKPRHITAEHFTDPVLGGAERRLAESVEEAIRLYGSPRKRR